MAFELLALTLYLLLHPSQGDEAPDTPNPPLTPDFKCNDAMDCELNGECGLDGVCNCIPGWNGPSCGTVDLLPAGFAGSWPSTRPLPPDWWGDGNTPGGWGGTIQRADDGSYHMIAASGCYLPQRVMHMDGWQLSHGISRSGPEGPYEFQGVVSPATSFNPHSARLPDGRYLLYHMGAPTVPTASGYNATCTGNETKPPGGLRSSWGGADETGCSIRDCFDQNCQPQQGAEASACIDAGCVLDPGFAECYPPEMNKTKYLHVRIADSLQGPFSEPFSFQISRMPEQVPSIAVNAVDNPSPLVIPDSASPSGYRLLLAFRFPGNDSWCGDHRCANSAIGLAEATHWAGPYISIGHVTDPAVGSAFPYLGWEDPTLFRGINGSLHILAHKYESGRDTPPGWPGVHAFSGDGGRSWEVSKQHDGRGAYSFEIEWKDGLGSTVFSRRERPELHVDGDSGRPLFLVSGVQYASDAGSGENDHRYSFVLVQRANI